MIFIQNEAPFAMKFNRVKNLIRMPTKNDFSNYQHRDDPINAQQNTFLVLHLAQSQPLFAESYFIASVRE